MLRRFFFFREEQETRLWDALLRRREEERPRLLSLQTEVEVAAQTVDLVRELERGSTLADLCAIHGGDPASWPSALLIRVALQLRAAVRDHDAAAVVAA